MKDRRQYYILKHTKLNNYISYCRGTADSLCQLKYCQLPQNCTKRLKIGERHDRGGHSRSSELPPRAALRLVQARVLCQMRAPYRPITRLPLPPIAGPQNCGPGCWSTPSTRLMRHCCRHSIGHRLYDFLLVVCSNIISVLHRFRHTTTFPVYVTVCGLEKSFSFDKTVKIAGHVRFPIHV